LFGGNEHKQKKFQPKALSPAPPKPQPVKLDTQIIEKEGKLATAMDGIIDVLTTIAFPK
jgi:hypothetical protein